MPSQLKQLKASLKADGLIGPQKSKKKQRPDRHAAAKRSAALPGHIRPRENPFEIQAAARGRDKYDVTQLSLDNSGGNALVWGRPTKSRSQGEQRRQESLLVEMRSRKRTGGITDRRFGENNPSTNPEDRMLERFVKDRARRAQQTSKFDLDDDSNLGANSLTHLGRSLSLDGPAIDDYQDIDAPDSDENSERFGGQSRSLKHPRSSAHLSALSEDGDLPQRKKSRKEVMKEVMAKSKLHKFERQQAKDEDDDARLELDGELGTIQSLMRDLSKSFNDPPQNMSAVQVNSERAAFIAGAETGPTPMKDGDSMLKFGRAQVESQKELHHPTAVAGMNPDRAALMLGSESPKPLNYDEQVRLLAFDKRSQPTNKSKSREEQAAEKEEKLKTYEGERLKRMIGEELTDNTKTLEDADQDEDEEGVDDARAFGLGLAVTRPNFTLEEEDDFLLDHDLIASGSEIDMSDLQSPEDEYTSEIADDARDEAAEFFEKPHSHISPTMKISALNDGEMAQSVSIKQRLPQTHKEFMKATKKIAPEKIPDFIRQLRSLHLTGPKSENSEKLGTFCDVLVQHLHYLGNEDKLPSGEVINQVVRHIHSLAKIFPLEVGIAFRGRLKSFNEERQATPDFGDLIVLKAIGTVFPPSDFEHPVITPATLVVTRYLGTRSPTSHQELAVGLFLVDLLLGWHRLSKRFIPEAANYVYSALYSSLDVDPQKAAELQIFFHPIKAKALQMKLVISDMPKCITLTSVNEAIIAKLTGDATMELCKGIFKTLIDEVDKMIVLWSGLSCFEEVMEPAEPALTYALQKYSVILLTGEMKSEVTRVLERLSGQLDLAKEERRTLELHHHRPIPIRTFIPRFEENFNPDKHYDPDEQRAEARGLKVQHWAEEKAARRELRKDANFIAREDLQERKEKDRQHEARFKRVIADIQQEEGQHANEYTRERKAKRRALGK
ncbi:MAG: nucleolar complex protein 14 [Vezdaea aestivalis]|nr:MAG: nucleolar complex protein 14 [Vezdaea aestivalis]